MQKKTIGKMKQSSKMKDNTEFSSHKKTVRRSLANSLNNKYRNAIIASETRIETSVYSDNTPEITGIT